MRMQSKFLLPIIAARGFEVFETFKQAPVRVSARTTVNVNLENVSYNWEPEFLAIMASVF